MEHYLFVPRCLRGNPTSINRGEVVHRFCSSSEARHLASRELAPALLKAAVPFCDARTW